MSALPPTAALNETLSAAVPPLVRQVAETLHGAGHGAWVVGGCVRDVLLAELRGAEAPKTNDWDLATSARPDEVMKLFRRCIPTGIAHGTVTVCLERQNFEVTTLRGETTYSNGRHPDAVYFCDEIEADLARRDFTVNAMAFDPLAKRLEDPFGGREDLELGLLRAVGDPLERFSEDGLRVLRAARFSATLELTLDAATEAAIRPSLHSYAKVSAERIRDEWWKALKAKEPSRAFRLMQQNGILAITAPALEGMVNVAQNRFHAYDVWEHTMRCLDLCPPSQTLRLAALLHDIGKPSTVGVHPETGDVTFFHHEIRGAEMAEQLLRQLRASNAERAEVVALIRHHLVVYEPQWTDAAVRRWLQRVGPERWPDLLQLARADVQAKGRNVAAELTRLSELEARVKELLTANTAFSLRDLRVSGQDLMVELAIPAGPAIGRILQQLLVLVVDDPSLNERSHLLDQARLLWTSERPRPLRDALS